mmetsp:Transcript_19396/g.45046  ORF Transcript_19396/g.45046 Transcript_19396/m.45046 type:complete len:1178 (+) Transcript_19396:56-3589(+)
MRPEGLGAPPPKMGLYPIAAEDLQAEACHEPGDSSHSSHTGETIKQGNDGPSNATATLGVLVSPESPASARPEEFPKPLTMDKLAVSEVSAEEGGNPGESHGEEEDWDTPQGILGWWLSLCHDHYYLTLLGFLVSVLTITLLVMVLPADDRCVSGAPPMQLQVCDLSSHEWELSYEVSSQYKDMLGDARTAAVTSFEKLSMASSSSSADEETPERSERSDIDSLTWVFFQHDETKNGETIFTPKKVKAICEIERLVLSHPLYKRFCQVKEGTTDCAIQQLSVSAQFYSVAEQHPETGSCPLLSLQLVNDKRKLVNGFFASAGANASLPTIESRGDTNTTRSLMGLAQPLKGFKDGDDQRTEQAYLRRLLFTGLTCPVRDIAGYTGQALCDGIPDGEGIKGVETLLFERFEMKGVPAEGELKDMLRTPYAGSRPVEKIEGEGAIGLLFYGIPTQQAEFNRVVAGDLNFAILSIIVVHFYIWFHTRSVFIANMSMFMIIMSLPVGFFVYYNIFGVRFYSQLNVLAIYLALGIGADSVFVAVDSWNQAFVNPHIKTTRGRLNYAMTRTISACFNTTLTTVMSFVATCFTPVMPIYAFAAFASSVLAVDYLFMVLFAPTWLMLYHIHFSDQGGSCCYCSRSAGGVFAANEYNSDSADTTAIRAADKLYSCCPYSKGEVTQTQKNASFDHRQLTEQERLSVVERFFHNKFSVLICGKKGENGKVKPFAYFFIAAFIAYGTFMIYEALQLTPPTAQEVWFPDHHMFNKELNDRLGKNWQSGADSDYLKLAVVFGMTAYDREGLGPSKKPAFIWLFPDDNRGEIIYDDKFDLAKESSQRFFMETCKQVGELACTVSACQHGKLVKKDAEVTCIVSSMLKYYNYVDGGNFTHPGKATVIPEAKFIPLYIRFFTEDNVNFPLNKRTAMSNVIALDEKQTKVKWAMIQLRSSMIFPLGNAAAHEGFKVIEDFKDARAAEAPEGMKSVFQTDTLPSGVGWTWMKVEDALVQNLFLGFAVCFPVAFVVLVFATGNVVIALMAVSTIIFIVGGVLGAARVYNGWDLGVAESIAGVIVIGFSVDYTVHLGHMYRDSPAKTREEKTRYALTYMGGTIVGGSLTTLLAGGVLFLCTLMFFTKMASLLVWTIVLSALYSLFYFTAMCAVFGPEEGFASVPSISDCIGKLRNKKD